MEANDFLVRMKANGNSKDWDDLAKVYDEYRKVCLKLSTKEIGSFSLNVLCLLCRNLEKVASWKDAVESKDLLMLSIQCIRETRGLNKAEQVKTLACIYHIHKHVIKKSTAVPPELILKISFMAFEMDSQNLLKEYYKTYWNILADRLTYLEKLKGKSLHKLLPKITEDILKIIDIYDTVQFCTNILVFLIKKLHTTFSENSSKLLNVLYGDLLKKLSSKNDLAAFKKLSETEILDLYIKMSDCLYVIAENASRNNFKDSTFNIGVRTALLLLGHKSDIFHCLQTFYLNSFADLFSNNSYADAIFKNLTSSCEVTEKLGYKRTMIATYAFLNQFFRLYIEYSVNNKLKSNFTVEIQESSLQFMLKVLSMLKYSQQQLKCDNCHVKTGLHDSLRLSFLLKHYITNSLENNTDFTSLTHFYNKIIVVQYNVINELKHLGCVNYKKFHQKLQTDTHNTAILLNRHKKYDFSIALFEIYINNELTNDIEDLEMKNICRGFYNKSICELDYKKYEISLLDAYLSLVFATELSIDKYMTLVMDIKSKLLKDEDVDEQIKDSLQLMSVVEACKTLMNKKMYENMEKFLRQVCFSRLLNHEFSMYAKLWPSMNPIAGVWRSLHQILEGDIEEWMTVENEDTILWKLLEVISQTLSVIRTIENEDFRDIVEKMLQRIDKIPDPVPVDVKVVQTTLLFLKTEYDIAEASAKYEWKQSRTSSDPDLIQLRRTIAQEHVALKCATTAVQIWTELAPDINMVSKGPCLQTAVQLADVFVQQFLYFCKPAFGLQLAALCCRLAEYTQQSEIYIRNVGVLAYHIDTQGVLDGKIDQAMEFWQEIVDKEDSVEAGIIFMCDVAVYYLKCGSVGTAEKLIRLAQIKTLETYDLYTDINLDLAVGRLMEAELLFRKNSGQNDLSDINGVQRHYLSVINNVQAWLPRRLRAATVKHHTSVTSVECSRNARSLALLRRARSAYAYAAGSLSATGLAAATRYTVNTHNLQQAQVTIDNRLKYIIGISTEQPTSQNEPKTKLFVPKQDLEVMLECQPPKCLSSPTRNYVHISGYNVPDFFQHNDCECYACDSLDCTLLSYVITGLESSMYFRANEIEISRNFFQGVSKSFGYFDRKYKIIINNYTELDFENYIVDYMKRLLQNDFKVIKLEIMIEETYFEMKNGNFDKVNDNLVNIHEILQDIKNLDVYINNEVLNLMIASAKMRVVSKKPEFDLENEFESLKLSPNTEAKTPVSKPVVPKIISKKVSILDEGIPKKLKVIKLNLDEDFDETEQAKPKSRRKAAFKIPEPVTSKPVLENMTPKLSRKPKITITNTIETPKTEKKDTFQFFTPQSTPEQFFTPMNTLKTYSKSTLRKGIVKNLEEEFSTPLGKDIKEEKSVEVPTRSRTKEDRTKAILRATSPGKLNSKTRTRQLRKPKFNED